MRSLVVAEEFQKRGHECIFAAQKGSFDMLPNKDLVATDSPSKGPEIIRVEINENDLDNASALQKLLPKGFTPNLAFVDSYSLNADYEKNVGAFSQKVVAFDDFPQRKHQVDFLIDPTFARRPIEYKEVMPEKSSIMTGVRFAPLREEFARIRPRSLKFRGKTIMASRASRHVVISMGLSDPDNVTSTVLEALIKVDFNYDTTVVIGKNSPFEPEIVRLSATLKKPANILVAHSDMALLLSQTDLVIGAGGSSSWERCCLGVPTLQVIVAENQKDVTNNLARVGAIQSLGSIESLTPDIVAKEVNRNLNDDLCLVTMSQSAALLCDGLGASRIVDHVETLGNSV